MTSQDWSSNDLQELKDFDENFSEDSYEKHSFNTPEDILVWTQEHLQNIPSLALEMSFEKLIKELMIKNDTSFSLQA